MEDYKKKFVLSILAYTVQRNISPTQLCINSGIDFKFLTNNLHPTVNEKQLNNLWKNASHLTGDPLFGLHFGTSLQLSALGIIGQIIQMSNTVGEALQNGSEMIRLITDLFEIEIRKHVDTFNVNLKFNALKIKDFPSTYRHMGDYLIAFLLHEMDGLLLKRIEINSLQLPYEAEKKLEYERIFRTKNIKFGSYYTIELPNEILEVPILSANYDLQKVLLKKMHLLLPDNDNLLWKSKIQYYLVSNSYLHISSLQEVASNFNMSVRSLQRKLREEGFTFLNIVDSVKKTLAINYLNSHTCQVKDVAYQLGYNEQSAFNKAFKRWTGETPVEYRKNLKKINL